MYKLKITTHPRAISERCHIRVACLMLMTSAASVMVCYGSNSTSFKSIRKNSLMPIDFRPHYTQLYQVEKLKAQILRGLNLTSVPEPPTKKPPKPVRILNRLPVPAKHSRQPLSAIVWSEPVDRRKKMADRLLFRVSNQRQKSASINRVSLVLRLRSNKHSKRKQRKKSRSKKNRQRLPDLKGKGIQNDQRNRASKKQSKSLRKKKSRSRRRKARRVKVLVQTMSNKSGKFKRVAVQRIVVDRKFHWVKLPIPVSVVSRAVQSSNQSLVLRLRCKRCQKGGVSIDSAVPRKRSRMKGAGSPEDHVLNPNRPYLVIFATNGARTSRTVPTSSRSARHVGNLCPPQPLENSTSCCAERLHVSFKDLGWDHWIVDPEGFTTTLCRGVCQEPPKIGTTPSDEQWISSRGQEETSYARRLFPLEHRLWSSKRNRKGDFVTPTAGVSSHRVDMEADSCQPQDRSSLAVMYYSDYNTLTHAVIPDLLTKSCSCVKK